MDHSQDVEIKQCCSDCDDHNHSHDHQHSKNHSHDHSHTNDNVVEFKGGLSDEAIKARNQDRFYVSGVD